MKKKNMKTLCYRLPVSIVTFRAILKKMWTLCFHRTVAIVYKYRNCGCNATYYGNTKRNFKVQIYEHLNISHLIWKKVKIGINSLTAIQEQL